MKRLLLLSIVICCLCGYAVSQNGRIPLTPSAQKSGSLQSNSMSGFSTTFSFNSIESQPISNEKGSFSEIYIDGSFPYGEVGSPSLPMVTRMIAIPQGATPVVTVNGYSEREYALADYDINTLSAKQAPVAKNIDPTTVEYVVNEAAYARNTYTTDEIASVEYLGTMYGFRLGKLTIRPVAYNATENTIKVRNDINVSVNFENANAALTQSMFASTYSPAFNSIYDQLLNKSMFGQSTIKGVYDTHTDMYHTPVKMLVICYSGFRNNSVLNQWLAWKLQKGYYVDIFYTDETGTTSANIANFIKTKYNASVSSGNAYTYLITIGDTGQVPQYKTNSVSGDQSATDIGYASIDYSTSSDYYPEMLYSRISVENTTHLENYLNKVLTYEKYEFADGGNYLNNVKIVGGWDSNWTSLVAGPTVNYASTYYFNTSNTTYGGFENGNVSTVTSTSSSAGYSGSNNGVYSGINNGFCFLNYTAHGDKQEWQAPQFTATQVASLTNTGKYFFAVGNCCLTGNFNNTSTTYSPGSAIGTNACFAETMIRVPNAGAIAYVGNSPVSYWFEDFYWAVGSGVSFNTVGSGWSSSYQIETTPTTSNTTMGVYDAMFTDEYWNSVSSLLNIGDIAVASAHESGNETSVDANYYWLYYHAFGDGSIMPYITKPEVNNVTHPASIMAGMTSLTVNAVAGSYVAVTDNESTIYGVAVANSQGVATVNFTEAIPTTGTLYVVVTRQQYQPYFGTVDITIANEPYVSIESYSPQNVSFGTTNDLSMTLVNMGGVATEGNTTVNLTTSDEYLTLNTSTAIFGVMAAQGGTASSSAFNFSVAENTPDGHVATINATITNGSHTWEGTMTVTVAGPACDAPTGLNVALNGADATITWDTQTITPVIISDDFEDHEAFAINSPGTVGWTYIDGDGASTYTFSNYSSWTNANEPMAYIVFNPTQVSYTGNGGGTFASRTNINAHSGTQFIAAVCSRRAVNDDWIISPELNYSEEFTFSFYCRGGHSGTETYEVLYSTTDNDASSFTNTLDSGTATGGTSANISWTLKSYNVPASAKYVAIHCNSNDQYLFCVDDITISGNIISGSAAVNLYDNGVLVASNLTSGTYTASNLSVGEHCFSIRAICADNSESMSAQSCVTVESILPSYTITVNSNNGGSVTPSGEQTVYEGNDFTFTATPNDCYEVASVTVDGNNVNLTNNQYTLSNVTANHTVNVTFSQITYTITASANNGGTITPAGTTTVNCNGSQAYTITPNEGYMISDVTVDGQSVGSVSTYSFTNVTANHTIMATFAEIPDNHIVIVVNAEGEGGSVSPSGSQSVEQGSDFTFTVTPDVCYAIGTVTVNGTTVTLEADNSYTITNVTEAQTINVTFNQITYTVVVNAGNGGSIAVEGGNEVACGENKTFSVTPDACHTIAAVTVNGTEVTLDANNSYTIDNVSADQTIVATFNQIVYTIAASAGNGGTITPAGDVDVNCGADATFTITPDNGYEIADVIVDGVSVGAVASYTFDNVTENGHSISATFEAIPANVIEIVINADAEGGSVYPTGTQTVTEGDDFTFTVTPDDCYTIGSVTVNGTPVELDENNSYTIQNVTTEQEINVTFNQIVYTIAASAGNGGTITPAGDVEVNCGADAVFTITPDEGYDIADVIVDGQSAINDIASYATIGASANYTFSNVTANGHSIFATFRQIPVEECNTVTNLEVSVEPYGNLISWTAAENAVSYNVFRNDETTAIANVLSTSYVDMNGNAGDRYHIVTICQYGESNASDEVEAIQTAIEENSISVELYPNPTDGKFMIECDEMVTVEIFNLVGQIVERVEASSNAITVDASAWTSGVYNVRITNADANIIVKQVVKQ